MRIRRAGLGDAEFHVFEQGQCVLAANDCCVVCLERETQKLKVAFFTFRWVSETGDAKVMAEQQAEILRTRLRGVLKRRTVHEMLTEAADECLAAYLKAEKEGWMKQLYPLWQHDCENCIYLGPLAVGDKQSGFSPRVSDDGDISFSEVKTLKVDLYYCPEEKPIPTVIARYNARPDGYHSGLLVGMAGYQDWLNAAYQRADELNLLSGLSLPTLNVLDCGNGTDLENLMVPVKVVVDKGQVE